MASNRFVGGELKFQCSPRVNDHVFTHVTMEYRSFRVGHFISYVVEKCKNSLGFRTELSFSQPHPSEVCKNGFGSTVRVSGTLHRVERNSRLLPWVFLIARGSRMEVTRGNKNVGQIKFRFFTWEKQKETAANGGDERSHAYALVSRSRTQTIKVLTCSMCSGRSPSLPLSLFFDKKCHMPGCVQRLVWPLSSPT